MNQNYTKSILITQCLQNDFCKPIEKFDPLPNLLHIGYEESSRLLGERAQEGPVASLMRWAYATSPEKLDIIHIRDWHNEKNSAEKTHLEKFGNHCLQDSPGADFVFSEYIVQERNAEIVNATGLNDFIGTNLDALFQKYSSENVRIGLVGVWTEAKVTFLAYDILTRYPHFEVAVCEALCASSSRSMHFIALDQMRNILDVRIFSSIGSFTNFLTGTMPSVNPGKHQFSPEIRFSVDYSMSRTDLKILQYLYRDSKNAEFTSLDGGFSGNVVLKASSRDKFSQAQVPTVVKIGERDSIAKERSSFERIQEIMGNTAPAIVDFAEYESRGGIKYRYAAMQGGKVLTFQKFYAQNNDINKITEILTIVFKKQLGRFTEAAVLEKINLLSYYDFSKKYAVSVKKRCDEIAPAGKDGIRKLTRNLTAMDICSFYERDLHTHLQLTEASHYVSYIHGDLNGANIILDESENIWLIDFFHTHRGHAIKDLVKLENDILYIFTNIASEVELEQAALLTNELYNIHDLSIGLADKVSPEIQAPSLLKTWKIVQYLRSLYADIIQLDKHPLQLFIAAARYAVHTLSFDECTPLQKKWALYACGILIEKIKESIKKESELRIDFLPIPNLPERSLGITLLPGRKDRDRNLDEDIREIMAKGIKTVICMLTENEFQDYGVPDLLQKYANAGINAICEPIADQSVPTDEQTTKLINSIQASLQAGKNVLIHCVGGLGRSGLIAALYLIHHHNFQAEQAIEFIRTYRSRRAIENKKQEDFVTQYAKKFHA